VEPITGQQQARRDVDEALMRRILTGDETALGTLYDRDGGLVYSAAKRILRETAAAEEVLQDIFHQIGRTAARFDFESGRFHGLAAGDGAQPLHWPPATPQSPHCPGPGGAAISSCELTSTLKPT
jgi:hypothetical protein